MTRSSSEVGFRPRRHSTQFVNVANRRSRIARTVNLLSAVAVVDLLKGIATSKNASPAQIALAWLLARKPFIVPIPGMDSTRYLDENIRSAEIDLTPEDLRQIEEPYAKIPVQGDRLSEVHMSFIDK